MTSEQETAMHDQPSGVSREELIEKAAKAMSVYEREQDRMRGDESQRIFGHRGAFIAEHHATHEGLANAALAVFEEAYTQANVSEPGKTNVPSAPMSLSGQIPTEGEREVLIALKLVFFSKQMDDGYPSTVIRDNEEAADLVLAAGFHRTVQAEPSNAQVEAALVGWRNEWNSDDTEAMRAALIAAAAIQGGETR